ncbi:unnamed protein product [Clonostachys chloroleuca]|uniref:Nucleoside phosphorylase domain-containing protein n=1 Tax=Clonostachys chloroleuca TaxID=1926264 RepID=A0AA35QCP4_9HYPO|nr:unnamed protein product [Clonostachys chloroleuca]
MDGFIARKEQPLYKYGDFVSGCAVRMDAAFILDRVKNTTLRNVAALDMESSAFLQACEYTGVKALGVIKGVADMGDIDQGKSHDRHYTALIRAAEAAKSFIKYKNIATEAVDRSGEPGALITHGYFDNFIARIMEKLEYAEYKVSAGNEIEGLRIVLPEELNKKPEEGNVDFNIASFNANDGGLARLVRKHGLQEVTLKGPPRQTNIHLKGPYLVDLPTTLAASLANVPGKDRQVNLFQKTLADKVKRYGDFVRVINWEEFVKFPSRQGIQTFAIEAATLFSILKPKYAVHVGVCAAISSQNIAIEDVIFGERALNYEEGKWALKDDKVTFKPDIKVAEVKGTAMDGFIAQANQPLYKYGDYISGSAVRMDASSIFDRVKNTTLRNVAALDMEASAFLQACEYTGVTALGVIKGVSDMADGNKGEGDDKHYTPALVQAAEAAKRFIKYKLETMPK